MHKIACAAPTSPRPVTYTKYFFDEMNMNVPMLSPKAQRIITVRASYLFMIGEVKIVRAPQTINVVLFRIAMSFGEISSSCYI